MLAVEASLIMYPQDCERECWDVFTLALDTFSSRGPNLKKRMAVSAEAFSKRFGNIQLHELRKLSIYLSVVIWLQAATSENSCRPPPDLRTIIVAQTHMYRLVPNGLS